MEKLGTTCEAKLARLEELHAELGQELLSRITSSSSLTVASKAAASPGSVTGGNVNSSVARPHLSRSPPLSPSASLVPICTDPSDARQGSKTVDDPWQAVTLLEGSMPDEGCVEHR
mmetsp:Transcript_22941/g.57927  ORF Transcript_22941/g.57927 Transcript_22941/m.57927 type:complete len:116 (-) Transcript_22941:8-355(-)